MVVVVVVVVSPASYAGFSLRCRWSYTPDTDEVPRTPCALLVQSAEEWLMTDVLLRRLGFLESRKRLTPFR